MCKPHVVDPANGPAHCTRVAGAAEFKPLKEAQALAVPCAFVLPLDDSRRERFQKLGSSGVMFSHPTVGTVMLEADPFMPPGVVDLMKFGDWRTLAYGNAFTFPGGTAPVLSTAASAVDVLSFVYTGSKLRGLAQKAFS